jgi:hypothetical protein
MNTEYTVHSHIAIAEALVRLYVLLTQHLDRTQYESARTAYPELELQERLSSTRAEIMDLLSVNRVVQHKVEQECDHVLSITVTRASTEPGTVAVADELKVVRTVLKAKILTLSDLLAVFRA